MGPADECTDNTGAGPRVVGPHIEGAWISALAVAAMGVIIFAALDLGPLAGHMAAHIATMNVVAPLMAALLVSRGPASLATATPTLLWAATILQMLLLWLWHSPNLQHASHASTLLAVVLHGVLLISALVFWMGVTASSLSRWHAILALLVSGKMACLLGILLVFSPRLLLHMPLEAMHTDRATADQHAAGLLMLAACPLSYILAAVIYTTQEIIGLRHHRAASPSWTATRE